MVSMQFLMITFFKIKIESKVEKLTEEEKKVFHLRKNSFFHFSFSTSATNDSQSQKKQKN